MTTADAYGDGRNPLTRALIWWGHTATPFEPHLYVAVWVFLLGWWWVPANALHPLVAVILSALGLAVVLTHVLTIACMYVHDRKLCWRDVMSSRILLDPQGEVDRNRRHLDAFHNRRRERIAAVVGFLPAAVLALRVQEWGVLPRLAFTAVAVVGVLSNLHDSHVKRTHHRLQPWCPRCHPPRDGDPTPAPNPVPSGSREN